MSRQRWPTRQPLFKNLDSIKFLTHESGCGESNQESAVLAALFAGYAHNANVAGITVLSLGYQKTQFTDLVNEINRRNRNADPLGREPGMFDKPILFFEQQDYGTEFDMLSAAIKETFAALIEANKIEQVFHLMKTQALTHFVLLTARSDALLLVFYPYEHSTWC